MVDVIDSFTQEYSFLSNFYPSPVRYGKLIFLTVEHAYQAAKSRDLSVRKRIQDCATPGLAKKMGRSVELDPKWETVKIGVMRKLVTRKFDNPELGKLLLETGNAKLVEGNWWNDRFWGVCRGKGQNHLGIILMAVRDDLKD